MTLRRRLDRLEARKPPALGPVPVTYWIVAPAPDGPRLCGALRPSDGLRIDRAPGETEAEFQARVEAAEKAAP